MATEHIDREAVQHWLQLDGPTDDVAAQLDRCVAAANVLVDRYAGPADAPRVEPEAAKMAALMLAAKMFRRRNSPEGIQGWSPEGMVATVARNDPDVSRLLRLDVHQRPEAE